MSRSYKKTPICKSGYDSRFAKKVANRKVRYYKKSISNGNQYRRISNSYDIYEDIFYYPLKKRLGKLESERKAALNQAIPKRYLSNKTFKSLVMSEHNWTKYYRRK